MDHQISDDFGVQPGVGSIDEGKSALINIEIHNSLSNLLVAEQHAWSKNDMYKFVHVELDQLRACIVWRDKERAVLDLFGRIDDLFLVEAASVVFNNLGKHALCCIRFFRSIPELRGLGKCCIFVDGALRTDAVDYHSNTQAELWTQALEQVLDPLLDSQIQTLMAALECLKWLWFDRP